MKIINFLELNENAEVLKKWDLESNAKDLVKAASEDFIKKAEKEFNVSGQWLVIDELFEIDNKYLLNFKNKEKEITWIKLPEKYVKEDYLVNYDYHDQCPLEVDVLIREDGYPIGVVSGVNSIKQAKVNNNLDGHKYKGEIGLKLNKDYFLTFDKEKEKFKIIKTHVDWDRGKKTI